MYAQCMDRVEREKTKVNACMIQIELTQTTAPDIYTQQQSTCSTEQ